MEVNELSVNAMGGTELMLKRIHTSLPAELLDQVQIIPSRVRDLDPEKIRILYCHDLPDDPEASKALSGNKWDNFHKLVFVSNWQMQKYIEKFQIPWSRCVVIPNAILPISRQHREDRTDETIRLIYHTTPHRGLNILYAVFNELNKVHPNIHLDVYSSFGIYGWAERDEQFREIFDGLDAHPNITNHGSVSNEEVREALSRADIFAYPSTWTETSCLALIEAMSAGLLCIHPNLGALYETSGSWTTMYQFHEDQNKHASMMFQILDQTIQGWNSPMLQTQIANQKAYADVFHNWSYRSPQWDSMIRSLLTEDRAIPEAKFIYRT